jgi:hypothetical protein
VAGLVAGGLYLATRTQQPPDSSRTTDAPAAVEAKPAPPATQQDESSLDDSAAKNAEEAIDEPPSAIDPESSASDDSTAPVEPSHAREKSASSSKPSEAQLLQQAQGALKTNPQRALALTREHRRLYPKGALTQEREVIAIEALSRLGEDEQAKRRAGRFESTYPESAHQKKVRTTVDDAKK